MNIELIEKIVPEIRDAIVGLAFREIFQLGENRFAIAFDGDDFRLLFISIEPRDPRVYLIQRRLRELKKLKSHPSQFAIFAARTLDQFTVSSVIPTPQERIVEIEFRDSAKTLAHAIVLQLTGTSSNCFLIDKDRTILSAARRPKGKGQEVDSVYEAPIRKKASSAKAIPDASDPVKIVDGVSISEMLDNYYQSIDSASDFERLANSAKGKIAKEIGRAKQLIKNLEKDLAAHGDAEKWKRFGDLLLANQTSAMRRGNNIEVKDLFDPNGALIEIAADENESITDAANRYFKKYSKARKASAAIAERTAKARISLKKGEAIRSEIDEAIANSNEQFLREFVGESAMQVSAKRNKTPAKSLPGIRRYISSDRFEMLVGKKAVDNDRLTLRIAHSRDTWLHAADYPGSHVVIRNPNRKEIPHRTLIEAAQLAAFFSQGNKQPKAAVNYTLKKFVSKPKGAAAGRVRLASFKTILVEPVFPNIDAG
ncbi:MAG: NFACT RNA binding domain-containing protein [Pyrinomonadaceae bacterium]